jgi:hypothetical protein
VACKQWWKERDILNYVEGREEDELSLVVSAHSFDVGFQDFYNMFAVLQILFVNSQQHKTEIVLHLLSLSPGR